MTTDQRRTKIVVSRRWAHPAIEAFVLESSVGARMELEDFINSLASELGNPLMILTRAQLLAKMKAAAGRVSAEMKDATKYVV